MSYITDEARKLLQRLTASNATLTHNSDTERFSIGGEILIGAKEKAAKEIIHLCAVRTESKLFPLTRFSICEEGVRILMRKNYVPIIIAARLKKQ